MKSKNISYDNTTGSSNIRNKSPCIIFTISYYSVKHVDTAIFASDGASFVNHFGLSNIDLLHNLNVETYENHFKFESSIHSLM